MNVSNEKLLKMELIVEPRKTDECFFCPDIYRVKVAYEHQYRNCIANRNCEYIDHLVVNSSHKEEYRDGIIENENLVIMIDCLNGILECGEFKLSYAIYPESERNSDKLFKTFLYDKPMKILSEDEDHMSFIYIAYVFIGSFAISSLVYLMGNIYSIILFFIGIIGYLFATSVIGRSNTFIGSFLGFAFGLTFSLFYQYKNLTKYRAKVKNE